MNKTYQYLIDEMTENQSIEQFLKQLGYSKKLIIHLRNTDMGITINQTLAYTTHILKKGEQLIVQLIETASSDTILPTPVKLNIIYEDDDLIVINKPAQMPVHPSQGHYFDTIANGVVDYFKDKKESFVFRAINRLDRDTTGLLLIAKHMLSAAILYQMARQQNIHKEYLACVKGCPPESAVITAPIGRAEGSTIERCVDYDKGETACTHFKRLTYDPAFDYSLIQLILETGRTHQIRVHMKHIGYPLLGDFLYYPDFRFISRQALHAHKLTLLHPITGKPLRFEAPLPMDMVF